MAPRAAAAAEIQAVRQLEADVLKPLGAALHHARAGTLIVAAVYAASLTVGIFMVHRNNHFALAYRDSLVARAHRADPAARAHAAGAHGRAAALDFARNLGLAAVPETVGGLLLILPPVLAGYRGWVGGIVSVDSQHRSRLRLGRGARYYLITLGLQLAAFTLAGAAGLHLGWAYFHRHGPFVGPHWFRLPRPALIDVAWLYTLIVPFFALGSTWEFFGPGAA